jgi:hypothetical protein
VVEVSCLGSTLDLFLGEVGRIERSQKLKTDVGNFNVGVVRNFGS